MQEIVKHYWLRKKYKACLMAGHLRAEDNSHKLILIPIIFPTTLSTPTSTLEMTIIHILMMTVSWKWTTLIWLVT